jgi:cytoplasmic tRNA 2-thiolation protein 1
VSLARLFIIPITNHAVLRADLPRLSRTASITTSTNTPNNSELTSIKRSKPLKYAYEKEIVLYAHHARLTYFSTECIYSPAAFRGTARTLLKDLERIRPEAILDIVRSGEDMAKLCPGYRDDCACDDETAEGVVAGCGGAGEAETQDWEKTKTVNEPSNGRRESIMSTSTLTSTKLGFSKPIRTMNSCERCGYMSSQAICQACKLLEGLNKSLPRVKIGEDHELGNNLAARAGNLSLSNG